MAGEGSAFRRCGCVDPATGRQYGPRCPRLGAGGRHGSWYVRLELPGGLDGRRRWIRRGGYPSRKAALEVLARLRNPKAGGTGGVVTVGDWLAHWLVSRTSPAASTVRGYAAHVRLYLGPYLGEVLLTELTVTRTAAGMRRPGACLINCVSRGQISQCDGCCAGGEDTLSEHGRGRENAGDHRRGRGVGGLQEIVLTAEESAAKRLADLVSDTAVDKMIADAKETGMPLLDGPGGLIGQLTARVIERALGAEMDEHLGYVKGDPAGNGSGNSRNGSYGKSVATTSGPARISVPRDRKSEFEPRIVAKGQRRVGAVDDMILSLYSRGMTTRDIHAHIAEVYGAEVSPALVSTVTDVVADEITEWQNRPLDAFYAILYIDALMVKIRDGGAVDNRAAYLVTGVDVDGFKHVLGIWLSASEGYEVLGRRARRTAQPRDQGRPFRLLRGP